MLTRRELIKLSAAASLAAAPVLPSRATGTTGILDDPAKLLLAYQRLSGSLDDRLIVWWMRGMRYGVVGAKTVALYGMEVGMFHRWFKQPDGSFKAAFFELTYYTDPSSGELLREFANPYTGATNQVRHVRLGPEIRHLTTSGLASPDNPLVHDYQGSLGPAITNADQVWIPASVEATIKFPKPTAPTILISIYTTVSGSLNDSLDSELLSAPCNLEFHNVLKWEPWMQMTEHPGHMMSMASGRKLESVDSLPDRYLKMASEVHQKYISDPVAALEKFTEQLQHPS